jgi:hypothetical protein
MGLAELILEWASVVAAFIGALFWLKAAISFVPTSGLPRLLISVLWSGAFAKTAARISEGLSQETALINAQAAAYTAIAILCQATSMIVHAISN